MDYISCSPFNTAFLISKKGFQIISVLWLIIHLGAESAEDSPEISSLQKLFLSFINCKLKVALYVYQNVDM